MWKHTKPRPEDYSTDEEYLAALDTYYDALDNYIEDHSECRWEE